MNEHGVDNENDHTVGEQMTVQTAKGVSASTTNGERTN